MKNLTYIILILITMVPFHIRSSEFKAPILNSPRIKLKDFQNKFKLNYYFDSKHFGDCEESYKIISPKKLIKIKSILVNPDSIFYFDKQNNFCGVISDFDISVDRITYEPWVDSPTIKFSRGSSIRKNEIIGRIKYATKVCGAEFEEATDLKIYTSAKNGEIGCDGYLRGSFKDLNDIAYKSNSQIRILGKVVTEGTLKNVNVVKGYKLKKNSIVRRYLSGELRSGFLDLNSEVSGYPLKANTEFFLYKNGKLIGGILGKDQTIYGYPFKKGEKIKFKPDGNFLDPAPKRQSN